MKFNRKNNKTTERKKMSQTYSEIHVACFFISSLHFSLVLYSFHNTTQRLK